MFNGIIDFISLLIYFKYIISFNAFFSLIIIKVSYLFLINFNIGCSFIINGICLTLIYKYYNFIELELSYETLRICNIFFKYLNLEKSLLLFNNIDGHFIYGHVNVVLYLFYKSYFINNFYKNYFLFDNIYNIYIFYKYSIFINGISLTINEIFFLNNFFIFCINLIKFTTSITNIVYYKLFDIVNIEFDLTIFFILKFLYINVYNI
ncbi:Riboflavin synthase eubacterial/eukaryotic [Candidatus Nasuia deltocephalinicola]|nr:Riboflavin synthase eubacterial/eukaryotic [Candidatus Nasuia deltocephalinicola]